MCVSFFIHGCKFVKDLTHFQLFLTYFFLNLLIQIEKKFVKHSVINVFKFFVIGVGYVAS